MRINKFLAQSGIASRRKIDQLIEEGRVEVNGKKAKLGQNVSEKDKIIVNGKKITAAQRLTYIILNKPEGVTSTVNDRHARYSVIDLVKPKERVYPVGRLDEDSVGLILLTNDGELTNRLSHPKYHVPKIYEVLIVGEVKKEKLEAIKNGVELEDGKTAPTEVEVVFKTKHRTLLKLTLYEGRKRQIRRMTAALHLHILKLKRLAIGPIKLGSLGSGKYRNLKEKEVKLLKKSAKLLN